MKVSIYGKKFKPEYSEHLKRLFAKLKDINATTYVYSEYAKQLDEDYGFETFEDYHALKPLNPDLMITLGGDGTILNAATVIRDMDLPILGINLGRLGFLASTEKNKLEEAIDAWVAGSYKVETRSMLELNSNIPIFGDLGFALNDFTIHKRDTSSMIKIHSYINGIFLNSYWADGLIVCTPTGSTGYSLSCGGPIIFPVSGNFAITPVAPHNLNVRPIVIPDDSEIMFKIEGRSENFLCTVDTRYETVTADHELKLRKSNMVTRLIQLEDIAFMDTIRAKLSWGFDARNQ